MSDETQSFSAIVHELELQLMLFFPDDYVPKLVTDVRDVYRYRSFLRQLPYTDSSFKFLLNLVVDATHRSLRFRTFDCLRVLKSIKCDSLPAKHRFPSETVDKLFEIYQAFISHPKDEIQWAVSVLLKDQILKDWQLQWLIERADTNINILNRLLLYPEQHPLLLQWATSVYHCKQHTNRWTEVIGLLIDDDIPAFVDMSDRATILWSIYRARVNDEKRKELLKKYWNIESIEALIGVCMRLKYADVLVYVHQLLSAA